MTTEPRPGGKRRLPKRAVRVWAYLAGGLTFLSSWAFLNADPKPPADAATTTQPRQVVVVHEILRRVVIQDPPQGGTTVTGGGGSGGGGQPIVRYVYANAPSAPPTSSKCSGC